MKTNKMAVIGLIAAVIIQTGVSLSLGRQAKTDRPEVYLTETAVRPEENQARIGDLALAEKDGHPRLVWTVGYREDILGFRVLAADPTTGQTTQLTPSLLMFTEAPAYYFEIPKEAETEQKYELRVILTTGETESYTVTRQREPNSRR